MSLRELLSPELYQAVLERLAQQPASRHDDQALCHTALQLLLEQQQDLQASLAVSSRLLEATQSIAHIGSVEMELPSGSIRWSDETYRLHDLEPGSFDPNLQSTLEYYLPESRERLSQALAQARATGTGFDLELSKYTFQGRRIDVRITCNSQFDNQGQMVRLSGVVQDITQQKRAQAFQQHHRRLLEMLLEKAPLAEVLQRIALDVEQMMPGGLCSLLLLDDSRQQLLHGAAPSLPDFFVAALDGMPIGPNQGACGAAAYHGKRVIVEDIQTDPQCVDYRLLAERTGLRACWSQPILASNGQVLGSFAIYHRQPAKPDQHDLALQESAAHLVALAIEQTRAETRLQLTASVFSQTREGILITDAQGTIIEVNAAFCDITGYSREEVLGKTPSLLQSGHYEPSFYRQLWRDLTEQGAWSGELWNRRKNGELFASSVTISAVRNSSGAISHYVDLFNDITPLMEHQRQLEYIAHYDALTQLPNRVLLADRMRQAIARSQRNGKTLAVLYIDLDGFKAVNDKHGHDLGDRLLVAISARLGKALRDSDTLARIGGDEFVVLLDELEQPNDYLLVLERLLAAAAEPCLIDEQLLRVSASIGYTLYPEDNADAEQLIRHADQAMYLAKQGGKNASHRFDIAREVAAQHQLASIERLRQALHAEEFLLYYQPQVNMKTGELMGVEALIRWQHPERGLVSPAEFLPIIENHPFSLVLGEWVIATALAQLNQWQQQGIQLQVSVNLSALQLQDSQFAQRLQQLLKRYPQVQPQQLELEIVETSALEDIAEVAACMRACTRLGVHFAVDDFGTGYASLTYLKRLPAEVLKIDQSFVRDMLDDPDDFAIIKGIIGLAQAFHRQVVAEGVESEAHGELLIPLGCELAQGYGIARPMPAEQILPWATHWQPPPRWRYFALQ